MLNSEEFDTKINLLFERYVPDSKNMGGEGYFRQDDDYGRRPGKPHNLGIIICLSQAYEKGGRDWSGLAEAVFNLTKNLILEGFEMGLFSSQEKIGLFFEGHTSNLSGASKFVEHGPENITKKG